QKKYKSIWFDYRGHQNSEIPKDLGSMTIENIASDLGALLEELDIREAVFLGHSMGVNVVLELFRQHPEKVAGMVLANGTTARPLATMFRSNAFHQAFELLRKAHRLTPSLVGRIWHAQNHNPLVRSAVAIGGFNPHLTAKGDIDLYLKQVAEMDPSVVLSMIENYNNYDATAW